MKARERSNGLTLMWESWRHTHTHTHTHTHGETWALRPAATACPSRTKAVSWKPVHLHLNANLGTWRNIHRIRCNVRTVSVLHDVIFWAGGLLFYNRRNVNLPTGLRRLIKYTKLTKCDLQFILPFPQYTDHTPKYRIQFREVTSNQ
jgi:hypothetical protein